MQLSCVLSELAVVHLDTMVPPKARSRSEVVVGDPARIYPPARQKRSGPLWPRPAGASCRWSSASTTPTVVRLVPLVTHQRASRQAQGLRHGATPAPERRSTPAGTAPD